jgi:hypothetical protein
MRKASGDREQRRDRGPAPLSPSPGLRSLRLSKPDDRRHHGIPFPIGGQRMNAISHDYDADDEPWDDERGGDEGDLTVEALIWQLLLRINPGDEEAAAQQLQAWQEACALAEADDVESIVLLRQVIDWKSGFHVELGDAAGFTECIDELSARFGLRVDWGVEDPSDRAFLDAADVPTLIGRAHEQLREHGYTLWTWSMNDAPREDVFAGWMALRSDDESIEIIAPALGIALRPGSAF